MRKILKTGVFLLISAVLICAACVPGGAAANTLVEFGSYPQSLVTDEAELARLESLSLCWESYGYYSGNGNVGSAVSGDYMRYADVSAEGERYRAVVFDSLRPMKTTGTHSSRSYQDNNGYTPGNVYWFRFEPLRWRILDRESGLMMCESIIDSQPFNNTIYSVGNVFYSDPGGVNFAHDYASSSLRSWLNNDFLNTAFSAEEQERLKITECEQQFYPRSKPAGALKTDDKVFLLSRTEATKTEYGFNSSMYAPDPARRGRGTDYAGCQGLHVCRIGFGHLNNSCWWLRAPAFFSRRVNKIFYDGYCAVDSYYMVELTDIGVRPCISVE